MTDNETTYYYPVVYFTHDEVSIAGPYDSYDKMMDALKKGVAKHPEKVRATTYITRKERLPLEKIFGCTKARNIMQDKKFLKEITQ